MGAGLKTVKRRAASALFTPRTLSLGAICLQSSAVAIIMHASQLAPKEEKVHYKASSAVLVTEFGKLILSSLLVIVEIRAERRRQALEPSTPPKGQFEPEPEIAVSYRTLDVQMDPNEPSQNTYVPDMKYQLSQEQLCKAGTPPPSHLLITVGHSEQSMDSDPYPHERSMRPVSLLEEYMERVLAPRWWLMALPALFFCIQNNLIYIAARCLPVPVFQVTFQLKILITALCACLMLGRRLSVVQWLSLLFLGLGVATIQLSCRPQESTTDTTAHKHYVENNQFTGFVAVIVSCFCSAVAATYFELTLKKPIASGKLPISNATSKGTSPSLDFSAFDAPQKHRRAISSTVWLEGGHKAARRRHSLARFSVNLPSAIPTPNMSRSATTGPDASAAKQPPSLWVRNVQLSAFSFGLGILVCLAEILSQEAASSPGWSYVLSETISEPLYTEALIHHAATDFFKGFNGLVWLVILIQCVGGLLTALVIKHADNVAKGLALSLSVLLTFALSLTFFDDFHLSVASAVGAVMVLVTAFTFEQHEAIGKAAMRLGLGRGSRGRTNLRWE